MRDCLEHEAAGAWAEAADRGHYGSINLGSIAERNRCRGTVALRSAQHRPSED
jgi:hypothetical protein